MRTLPLALLGLSGCMSTHLVAWDLGAWQAVEAGDNRSCGLATNGSVHCWGIEVHDLQDTPTGRFVELTMGVLHACALDEQGKAVCWGLAERTHAPDEVLHGLSAGEDQSCGLTEDGALACWGLDYPYPADGGFTSVSMGPDYGCALDAEGHATCWGSGVSEEDPPPTTAFVQISSAFNGVCGLTAAGEVECWSWAQGPPGGGVFSDIDCDVNCCGLLEDGEVQCWRYDEDWDSPPDGARLQQVSVGQPHSCGVRLDGSAECWGSSNQYGELDVPEDPL